MKNAVFITKKISNYKKNIQVSSDKSLSIRWALMASQAIGVSRAYNLLESDDIKTTLNALKRLGIKIKKNKNFYEIFGKGLNGFSFKNNIKINAGNSGTFGRLILGLLAKSNKLVHLTGDKSLSKRDFTRVIKPLNDFGVKIISNKGKLPLKVKGTNYLRPIDYCELKGSSQIKSCIMLAALNTPGTTKIKCKPSRNHTELLFQYLKLPIKVKKKRNFDLIEIEGQHNFKAFDYHIPSDISSASFFIILTLLAKNSQILLKNINVNRSRTGIIDILKKMNSKITLNNKRIYKGEEIADIFVKSSSSFKAINCPININSRAIDEFLIIFLIAAKAKGVSYFKDLSELNKKESPRLKIAAKFLKMIGIKVEETNHSIKIYGNPKLELNGKYEIKNFLKDHRVFMMSCIAALTLGGTWKINDKDSIKTSFPSFIKTLKKIGAKIN